MKAIYNIKPCPNFRHKPASLDELVAELEEARDTHWLPTFTLVFDSNDDEIWFPWDSENKKQTGWGCLDANNHYYQFDVDVDKMSMRECLENCWLYPKSGSWVCAMLVTPLIYGVFAQYRVSPVG